MHRETIPIIREALTFDDVLLQPGHSQVMPGDVDIGTRLTRSLSLALPIISSAMDTVTEARLAIAMAQAGGIGVIHRNLTPQEQADEVRRVKKFESGMVVNPLTIQPEASLAEALDPGVIHINMAGCAGAGAAAFSLDAGDRVLERRLHDGGAVFGLHGAGLAGGVDKGDLGHLVNSRGAESRGKGTDRPLISLSKDTPPWRDRNRVSRPQAEPKGAEFRNFVHKCMAKLVFAYRSGNLATLNAKWPEKNLLL